MKIAICDDEIYFAGKLREILMQYLEERHIDFEIELFSSGREFVELGVEMLQYQIIFLDINMKQMDRIETAKNVRHIQRRVLLYLLRHILIIHLRVIRSEHPGIF